MVTLPGQFQLLRLLPEMKDGNQDVYFLSFAGALSSFGGRCPPVFGNCHLAWAVLWFLVPGLVDPSNGDLQCVGIRREAVESGTVARFVLKVDGDRVSGNISLDAAAAEPILKGRY